MIRSTIWILFSLYFITLFAEEETIPPLEPFNSSLVETQSLLSTIVDSVSTISGDWLISETDLVVLGPDPLVLNRHYSGDLSHSDKLGYNWDFNRPHKLIFDSKEKGARHFKVRARLNQASGVATIHSAKPSDREFTGGIYPLLLSRTQGLTNCRSGEISAKTNLHNTFIELSSKDEHCAAISGNGNLTYYAFPHRQDLSERREQLIGMTSIRIPRFVDHYKAIYERKANGNTFLFKNQKIIATDSSEKKHFGDITFYHIDDNTLIAQASDGKTVRYKFTTYNHFENRYPLLGFKKKQRYYLEEVNFSHKPKETYEYTHQPPNNCTSNPNNPLLKCRRLPDNRFQEVEYYQLGKNHVDDNHQFELWDEEDFRINRVKFLKAPVGTGKKAIITHRFIYEPDKFYQPVKKKHQKFSGKTIVYDAYSRKTVYEYNVDHRPTSVKRYGLKNKLYFEECYVWDDKYFYPSQLRSQAPLDSSNLQENHLRLVDRENLPSEEFISSIAESIYSCLEEESHDENMAECLRIKKLLPKELAKKISIDELIKACSRQKVLQWGGAGNLIGKYRKNNKDEILYAQFFDYDDHGNITLDRFYGNLTGTKSEPILLDLHQKPRNKDAECYKKRFTYSDAIANLLLTEKEDNGKGIEYEYYPNSDLVSAKYVTENAEIRFRQFFIYDSNATLTKLIKDDGCAKGEGNLKGVSERQVTEISPRQGKPFGLPECIEEKYVDLGSLNNPEILLKKVSCEYDQEGHLLRQGHYDANNTLCYFLEWNYDTHGNVTFEKNALGQILRKKYDENDNLIYEEGPYYENQPSNYKRSDICKTHTYDYVNRLTKTVEKHPDDKTFCISHEYDYIGNRISTTNRYGEKTLYKYDGCNRLKYIQYPTVLNDQGEQIEPSTLKKYDSANRLISTTDACKHETKTTYNARGAPLTITYPDSTVERFEYNLDGTLAKSIAPNGTQTVYVRDFLGRVLQEEIHDSKNKLLSSQFYTYKGLRLISQIDAERCETTYAYDGAGRLKEEIRVDNQQIYDYDSLGRVEKITAWYGNLPHEVTIKVFKYDLLNRPIEERIEDAAGIVLHQILYAYDEQGNRIQTTLYKEAGESVTSINYNSDKKPIKIVNPEGETTYNSYEEEHRNILGQNVLKVTTTDALGRITQQIHDALGRVTEVIRKDPLGMIIAQQNIFYDPMGRRTKTIDTVYSEGIVLRSSTNTWHYHANGQEDEVTEAFETPLQKTTTTRYNTYGEKWKIIKPDGEELTHEYDPFGRLSQLTSTDNAVSYTYKYNLRHQIKQVEDLENQTITTYDYDNNGRLKEEKLGNDLKMVYDYDRLDRLKELTLPDGSAVKYLYDAAHLKEVQRYKKKNLVYKHVYSRFDRSGDLLSASLIGKGGDINYAYDRAGRPKQTNSQQWSQQVYKDGYDPVGRLVATTIQDALGNTPYVFSYDDLDHLTKEQGHVSNTYQIDSIHNRVNKNQQPYEINALNQINGQSECIYKYDLNGNLKCKIQGSQVTNYDYDALNRLIAVYSDTERTDQTEYLYDAFNRRLSKVHKGITYRYLYQGQDEIACVDEKGQIQELRILGSGLESEMGSAVALELYGKIFAPIHDQQGHLACLVDSSTGQTAEAYRYTAFGEETIINVEGESISDSQVGNPWRYACKRIDPETGWIYFGRRYYDPEVGRWTTPDPLFFEDGPNLYAYLHHSPIMRYDAYGLFADETHSDQVEETYSPIAGVDRRDRQKDNRSFFQKTKDAFCAGFKDPFTGLTKRHLKQYCIDTNQTDFIQSDQRYSVETEKKTFTDEWCDHCENTGAVIAYITVVKGPQMAKSGFAGLTGFLSRKYFGQAVRNELEIASTRAAPGQSGPITVAETVETSVGQGLTEVGQVPRVAEQYTRSNLRLGQQTHKTYREDQVLFPDRVKEYILPSKRRIDFIDIKNGKIYELKPNNPRSIKQGQKQLDLYKRELETMGIFEGVEWETILETY